MSQGGGTDGDVARESTDNDVVERHDLSPGDDVERFPEPPDPPDPHAQWDEVRGVWEVWDDETDRWTEITTPIAPDVAELPDATEFERLAALDLEDGHGADATFVAEIGGVLGIGNQVGRVGIVADMVDRDHHDLDAPHVVLPDAVRIPEPDERPDRHAQWDEIRGVWQRWDNGVEAWVDLPEA